MRMFRYHATFDKDKDIAADCSRLIWTGRAILALTICDPNFVNVRAGKVAKSDSNGRNGEQDKRAGLDHTTAQFVWCAQCAMCIEKWQ